MAGKSTKVLAVLLMASFMAAFVPTGAALVPVEHEPFDSLTCWKSITTIHGCAVQLYAAVLTGGFQVLGPTCCKAITAITDNCWPKMFPHVPFFPPLLKKYCGDHVAASATENQVKPFSRPAFDMKN